MGTRFGQLSAKNVLSARSAYRFYYGGGRRRFRLARRLGGDFGVCGVGTTNFMVARESMAFERNFQALATQGVGIWLGVQGFINMGVNMGMLPTKGLTLPFISYGGSALMFNCLAMAFVLRVDYENRSIKRGDYARKKAQQGRAQ